MKFEELLKENLEKNDAVATADKAKEYKAVSETIDKYWNFVSDNYDENVKADWSELMQHWVTADEIKEDPEGYDDDAQNYVKKYGDDIYYNSEDGTPVSEKDALNAVNSYSRQNF